MRRPIPDGPRPGDMVWIVGIAVTVGAVYFVVTQRAALSKMLASKQQTPG